MLPSGLEVIKKNCEKAARKGQQGLIATNPRFFNGQTDDYDDYDDVGIYC